MRKLSALPAVILLLPLDLAVAFVILMADIVTLPLRWHRRDYKPVPVPDLSSITIQILNWDGRHLLEQYLPSVTTAVRHHSQRRGGRHEVVVVDNGSTDGSIEFLKMHFPEVRVVSLDRNYGFAIGNNRGFGSVRTDVVVLLNNDMQVSPDFLEPLLESFSDPSVFAVTSQILFADVAQRREETGKTRARFERGAFTLWHDEIHPEDEAAATVPVFWAGGGSCAVDLRKLTYLGGIDSLYHPFYVEDVDISYQAWKRGWKSLMSPRSVVAHQHRGTSRPKFGDAFVDSVIRRNQFLFVWKNLTDFGLILQHLTALPRIHGRAIIQKGAAFEIQSYARALLRLPFAVWRRITNLPEYRLSDREVLKCSQ